MSEMVERVAKALHTYRNSATEQRARKVIEAMREPTEDMLEQGFIRPPQWDHDSATVLDVWQAMIDEALK